MNQRLSLKRLWWKELRQLVPMVATLPALVVALLLFHWLAGTRSTRLYFSDLAFVLCLGMPGLFACGAGALLVGYEKELRTIDWLRSLPISPRRIVRVKVLAALVCLLVLWLVSVVIFAVASGSRQSWVSEEIVTTAAWLFNSLFVLLAGFALAWKVRSALVALLLVVPAAAVPYVLAAVVMKIWQISDVSRTATEILVACQIVTIGLAWWTLERTGMRALSPTATGSPEGNWLAAESRDRGVGRWTASARIQPPISALVWQFAKQNRAILWGISIMLAIAVVLLATSRTRHDEGPIALSFFLAFLGTSWLGVTVFQSDSVNRRVRFLSDRGITPRAIWLTRHAIPLGLLALFALLLVVVTAVVAEPDELDWSGVGLACGTLSLMAILIYLSSQWVGQVVFSTIVAAIAAPLVALGALTYGIFAIQSLGTPWWLAMLVVPIPAIATRTMTRRWADRRLGFSYWASHTAFLAAACLLPAVPLFTALAMQPKMPDEIARELAEPLRTRSTFQSDTYELVVGLREEEELDGSGKLLPQKLEQFFDRIEEQLETTNRPIGASSARVITSLQSAATIARMSLTASSTATAEPTQESEALQRYRRAVDLLVRITERMRRSPQIRDQDFADLLEIWLLSEMQRHDANETLGDALYETTARMLSDTDARKQARLYAIAFSWREFHEAIDVGPAGLGGYEPVALREDIGNLRGSWIAERRVGMAVVDLWELAGGGPEAATRDRLTRIADFWGKPVAKYGIGPQGIYTRADDLDRFLHPSLDNFGVAIASQWNADWERIAAEQFGEELGEP